MRNKPIITPLIVFTLLYLCMTLVSAQTGCCFNPNDGLCDMNADEASCNDHGGEFFSSPSCSVSECDLGCCVLGTSTLYVTSRTCELQSRAFGYEENFQSMDSASCAQLASSQEYGACLFGGDYEQDCRYVPRSQCGSSDFHEGVLCTNESLNTICEKTEKTTCWSEDGSNEDVYYLDSCGNKDALKNDCNYQSGTLCAKESSASSNYICKDLSCKVGNKTWQNGESWCVFASGIEGNGQGCNMANEWWIGCFTDLGKVEANTQSDVGSRYLKKYCLNGKVETEPCSDYRTEYCLPGKAEKNSTNPPTSNYTSFPESNCKQNPWTDCLGANGVGGSSSAGGYSSQVALEQELKKISESCDKENCFMLRALDCVTVNGLDPSDLTSNSKSYCGSQRNNYVNSDLVDQQVAETTSVMMQQLQLERCLPKIAGGLESGSSSPTKSTESVCSMGNFEGEIMFLRYEHWHGGLSRNMDDRVEGVYVGNDPLQWGNAALVDSSGWGEVQSHIRPCTGSNKACEMVFSQNAPYIPANPMLLEILNKRCSAIADCQGKVNWQGKPGSNVPGGSELIQTKNLGKKTGIYYTFTYTCSQWKAPSSDDDCSKCGEDGLPCSEYRCESLGKKCEFQEPESADRGYCVASTDNTGPTITSFNMNPKSPVPPYEKVYFNLTTNEVSECKFNLNNAGATYDEMKYDFGSGFSFNHEMILSLPGQVPNTDSLEEYALIGSDISKDLNYTLYVRCLDAAGNGEASVPYAYNFQVMKTPDTIAPTITSFSPASGSAIAYNTTTKLISFKMNEPGECKWDLNDKKYEDMENSFECETVMKVSVDNNGYSCEGTLTNVTTNMSLQTKYFIRCSDQPWLVNGSIIVNHINYSRNTNPQSIQYILRPSSKLNISEISPIGTIKKPETNISVELKVITSGGAASGKAECWWKLNNGSAIIFKITNTSTSKQTITSPNEGTNNLRINCNDIAGNSVEKNASFNLIIDKSAPFINRIYWYLQNLKIKTDEESICYVSLDKSDNCLFDMYDANTSVQMSGTEKEHATEWKDDKTYYIKCKDYFGNYDSGCGKIVRAY